MVSAKNIKKIINAYYNLEFESSFGGLRSFYESVRKNLGIAISFKKLKELMQNEVLYQTNVSRPKSLMNKHIYTDGALIEAYCDCVYFQYGRDYEKKLIFLIVIDIFTKYIYTTPIKEGRINSETLTKAFERLFRRGMPHFSILRSDRVSF